jgi:uncharacterized protein (TIGR02594 family)
MKLARKRMAVIFLAGVACALSAQAMAKPQHRKAAAISAANMASNLGADRDPRYSQLGTMTTAAQAQAAPARVSRRQAKAQTQAVSQDPAAANANPAAAASFGSGDLVSEARQYLGGNPTGRGSLWCGAFMDLVLKKTGHQGGGNLARGYASYGTRVSGPQVGAIAVMGRRGGGHVGVVSGIDSAGNPIIISGNHNNRVAESVYPRGRIIAYVMP